MAAGACDGVAIVGIVAALMRVARSGQAMKRPETSTRPRDSPSAKPLCALDLRTLVDIV
jgi:hypothetical protein